MLYLLTGEYDPNTSPAETRELAELVKGAKFWEMPRLGHFPVTEDYTEFRKYLLPILAEIQDNSSKTASPGPAVSDALTRAAAP